MSHTTLQLASLGGLISFLSTSAGALLSQTPWRAPQFMKFKFSIDFALGLMLSAVAFSLVRPATASALNQPGLLALDFIGFVSGGLVIYSLKALIESKEAKNLSGPLASSSQLILALALIIHNFPEGLASGAALAGLNLQAATSILTSISIQNIPEGLLMVLCLKAMGWTPARALLGGIISGLVELAGGVVAGFALAWTSQALPVILMVAGGAMFTSVVIEIIQKGSFLAQIRKPEFAVGMLSVPLLNLLIG